MSILLNPDPNSTVFVTFSGIFKNKLLLTKTLQTDFTSCHIDFQSLGDKNLKNKRTKILSLETFIFDESTR